MVSLVKRCINFIRYNEHKSVTLQAWIYSAFYRFQIVSRKVRSIKKHWGIEGEESSLEVTPQQYRYAKKVSYAVSQVCSKTKWESKCLVRALTAQKLLKKKKIGTTLYLGCKYDENGKMVAHAWLRCGQAYVTGGNGEGYAVVDKFKA